jgi:hypothetical protein
MAWRDDIARYAENGDTEGVLRIFDELWSDRERRMSLNAAYLQQIAELKGAPKAVNYDRLEAAFNRLTDAVNGTN